MLQTSEKHPKNTFVIPNPAASPHQKIAPGPRSHFLLGNALEMQRDPIGFVTGLAHQYGDIARMRLLSQPAFLISHPDFIKHVLQDNHRNYDRNNFTYKVVRSVVGNGLATIDGASWLHQRRLMQPAFHHKRITAFGTHMTTATLSMLQRWQQVARQGQSLDISAEMHRLTLNIVGQTLFSLDLSDEAHAASQAFATVFRLMTDYLFLPFPPLSVPTPRNLRLKAALRTLDHLVSGVIHERRQQSTEHGDLLSMLLEARDEETGAGMSDRQVRDEVMTLLLAGHETTANTLNWTWYLLSQHPEAEQRLHAELDSVLDGQLPTVERLAELPYTHLLIEESMRLYPASWAFLRHAVKEDEIGGYSIPANSLVWMSPYVTQRHPGFWDHPDVFDPERFTPERSAGRPRFAYFPFGGGPHQCIGNSFSMMEAQLLIATIAQRYRLHLLPGHVVKPKVVLTMQPANGLPMTLQER